MLLLAGPTAVGKTPLAIALAQRYGAEIVGADARQIYRGMPIGTAAPTPAQRAQVPHHLIGFLDPHERYSAARYAVDAMAAIEDITARGLRTIVVGGTGFYVRALSGDVRLAPYDPFLRERVAHEARVHPPDVLHDWLRALDPARAERVAPQDRYRLGRALEVALGSRERTVTTGTRPSDLRAGGRAFAKVFVDADDALLESRIASRVEAMLAEGLVEEAERIGPGAVAADAVGYPQALAYARGWATREELRTLLARATRRYAKRQRTWFRREPGVTWLSIGEGIQALEAFARDALGWK